MSNIKSNQTYMYDWWYPYSISQEVWKTIKQGSKDIYKSITREQAIKFQATTEQIFGNITSSTYQIITFL